MKFGWNFELDDRGWNLDGIWMNSMKMLDEPCSMLDEMLDEIESNTQENILHMRCFNKNMDINIVRMFIDTHPETKK